MFGHVSELIIHLVLSKGKLQKVNLPKLLLISLVKMYYYYEKVDKISLKSN